MGASQHGREGSRQLLGLGITALVVVIVTGVAVAAAAPPRDVMVTRPAAAGGYSGLSEFCPLLPAPSTNRTQNNFIFF